MSIYPNDYRTLHPATAEHVIFSRARDTFTKIDNMLAHKTSLNKFKRIKILQRVFSEHSGIQLEINNNKVSRSPPSVNNTLLNNSWAENEVKGKLENIFYLQDNKNKASVSLWAAASAGFREELIALNASDESLSVGL